MCPVFKYHFQQNFLDQFEYFTKISLTSLYFCNLKFRCSCDESLTSGTVPKPRQDNSYRYYSTFIKLLQSCSDPHLKILPIAIFAFYSLNYSLAARLQDNSRPKSPTKVETKRKLQQFTVSGWLIMKGGESGIKNKTLEITFNMKRQYNY